MKKIWNMKVAIIPILISAFGTVTKALHWFTKKLRKAQKYPFLPNLRVLNSNLKSVFTHHL